MLVGGWGWVGVGGGMGWLVNYGETRETPPLTHKGLWLHTAVSSHCWVCFSHQAQETGGWGRSYCPTLGAREGRITLGGSGSYEVTEWQRRSPPGSWLLLGETPLSEPWRSWALGSRRGQKPGGWPVAVFIMSPSSVLPCPLASRSFKGHG